MRVVWTKRPVKLLSRGDEQCEIQFLDTGTITAISTDQLEFENEQDHKLQVQVRQRKNSNDKVPHGGGLGKKRRDEVLLGATVGVVPERGEGPGPDRKGGRGSKCLADYVARNSEKLRDDFYKDADGWWLYTKKGWQATPHSACHTIHADTIHQLVKDCKHICRCECEECLK